jgi:CelD/BcsL family acetyltransferase involved in cellulose biosynthesis
MEYAFDVDRVSEVDYLTGDDPYKKQWMSHRRERWGIMAFNPWTLRGCLTMAKNIGGHALKQNYLNLKQAFGQWQSRGSSSLQSGS